MRSCNAGMRELLETADDESQQEIWPRVHAINTLRLTYNDKNLANDVSGFFAQGRHLLACTAGLAGKARS